MRKRDKQAEVFNDKDEMFKDYWPNMLNTEEAYRDSTLHPEFKKMIYSNLP